METLKPLEWHGTNKPYTAMDVIIEKQRQQQEEKEKCSDQ
ncbi:hypothetical protein KP12_150 [Klebsiella phage KP12]|uniref:Uncharacterized protein n=1 Tax=Klebsiella phage KP12 TaxID=2923374 RepID=A0A9E6YZL3_9CAUD|nr:hypothetical protein KP12_150 [Klebsiella phage KP12]